MTAWTWAAPLALAVLLAGCSSEPPATQPSVAATASPAVSSAAVADMPKEVEHVHNLALLPDGDVLLGTHEGLWRQEQPGEPPALVGEPFDVMGLAVTPQAWLASGHPGPGAAGPADLGLLRSRDEGASWQEVSLSGKVEFHRLTTSGRTILGANSGDGLLWRSADRGATWQTLGPAPFDIALDPQDPRRVVGTTAEGPVRSGDGGQSWKPMRDAARVALLAWSDGGLFGVDERGAVHRSADRGLTWERVGTVSVTPQAFAADGSTVAVIAAGKVLVSADGGRTFDVRLRGIPQG